MLHRLHSALALALLTPACGGETIGTLDRGPKDGSAPEATQYDTGYVLDAPLPPEAGTDTYAPDVVFADVEPPPDVDVPDVPVYPDGGCHPDIQPPKSTGFCDTYEWAPCGTKLGSLPQTECRSICPRSDAGAEVTLCSAEILDGYEVVQCTYCIATGRRPEGASDAPPPGDTAASFFAHCAWLEAASVHAFRRLARELAAHGAPARLIVWARRAAREEVRHAAVTSRLARRHGGAEPAFLQAQRRGIRDLAAIAHENAVEGCVRETYGALVALWQAEKASDPVVRQALALIARDEARHAELAWETMAWLESKLSPSERAEVARARREAIDGLRAELRNEPARELVTVAGLPGARDALRLLEAAVDQRVFDGQGRAA